jgi:hypothetical protein
MISRHFLIQILFLDQPLYKSLASTVKPTEAGKCNLIHFWAMLQTYESAVEVGTKKVADMQLRPSKFDFLTSPFFRAWSQS